MTFRKCAAAAWFVVASFAVCAHATAAETSPSVIRGPVEYPASAVSAGEEGTVQVVAEVDVDGKAGDAKIYSSSGYRDLDAAALRSIAGWSFTPGTKDGKPVAQEVIVPVGFKLIHDAACKGVRDNLGVCSGITAKPPDGIEPDGVLSHPCAVVHPPLRRSRVNG
jgi:protein TonB